MKKIAITGGIGSGKSLAGKYISEQGYDVFSCDEIYAELICDPNYINKIKEVFPSAVEYGKINRKKLGELVFNSKDNKTLLDSIAHPLIMQTLEKQMNDTKGDLVFAEVPLLFENNFQENFDYVIVILRDLEKRILAVMQRNTLTRGDCLKRIAAQFDYDTANEKGAFPKNCILIENNLDQAKLKEKILSTLEIVKHKS